jgi:hypothetical protein
MIRVDRFFDYLALSRNFPKVSKLCPETLWGLFGLSRNVHHGMMDPDEQLARMTTRYSLTTEQQDQVKPILVSEQHQMQGLRQDTALTREDRMAKMQTIRSDSNAKIKAVLNDDQKKQFEQDQLRMQRRMQQQGQGAGSQGGTPPL